MSSSPLSPLSAFSLTLSPEEVESLTTKAISDYKSELDSLSSQPSPTFSSLLVPLSRAEVRFSRLHSVVDFPQYVSPSPPLRDASAAADKRLSQFLVDVSTHLPLFRSLQKLESQIESEGEEEKMDAEDKRYLHHWLRDFRRNGMALSEEEREKVVERKKRVSELCIDFQKNLNEDNSSLSFALGELEGLPSDFIEGLEKKEEEGGEVKYVLTCKYPHVLPTLRQCKVQNTRRAMEEVFSNMCKDKNTNIAEEVFSLRHEIAQILGYATWADYILEIRMAKNTHTVKAFYEQLVPKLNMMADEEMRVLLDLKKADCGEGNFDGVLNAWDYSFYFTKLLRENYGVDEEHIKHYFPADKVIRSTLEIYQELLSVTFDPLPDAPVWHEEVQCYKVSDKEAGNLLGFFYMDLHPREGKYGHAAAFPLQGGCLDDKGERQSPISAMVCNFPKSTHDTPALLRHSDFVTFFHEFGHIMHGILGHTKYARFAGTATERDFVECPSQTLENFCFEKEILRRVSSHHSTGEHLPDDLIDKLIKAKKVGAGLINLRQCFFGLFDQTVHSQAKVDSEEVYGKMRTEITRIQHTKGTNPTANFGHLLGGYDASYYGYLWAEVFSLDVFSVFLNNGVMDAATGMRYRQCILAKGGKEDAEKYLLEFLGREPNQEAFLRDIGVAV